jgi:trehalose/maltose transport system substrate-binding protein
MGRRCLHSWLLALVALAGITAAGCTKEPAPDPNTITITFKHSKLFGDPAALQTLIEEFEREHKGIVFHTSKEPGIRVKDETLPSSSDEQHQFYVINLEAGSSDFDVFAIDVIWVAEFAKAGWLRDLSKLLPAQNREEFFHGPIEAVTLDERVYAIPWFIDAGVLYYRKDLLKQYDFQPPPTWSKLVRIAYDIRARQPDLYGFIWQGKQYEGLVCNVLEFLWSNGGEVLRNGKVVIDSPQNREALKVMVDLVRRYRMTPDLVTALTEESSREIFGRGKAVFMRNWPYAWRLLEQEGSAVKGKVGITVLPHFRTHASAATLGGWQLGVNSHSKHPQAAEQFVAFMTSAKAQKHLGLTVGFQPTRKALYDDAELLAAQPALAELYKIFQSARPRPVSPYYVLLSQAMQSEFSAALAGVKTPEEALRSLQSQMEQILKRRE